MKMGIVKSLLQAVIINCFFVVHCKSVDLTLGVTKEHYVLNKESLLIECILNSGTLDITLPRTWTADAVTLIRDGLVTSAGSGYSETLGTDRFSLTSPPLDYNADGRLFQCNYGFSQGSLNVKIYGIESTDQSKGDCINEKSIHNCWFSLEKVIPEVSSTNLTVLYEDGTMDDINSMLNITSTLNADGKTRAYHFKIESASFSKDVKEIKLTFIVGPISRTLTIKVKGLTIPSSTFSLDMSTTVSEPLSTINSNMPTTVSEVPPPQINTSSAGLSQEIVITITISSSILAAGVLIFLTVVVVKQCRQKNKQTLANNKENHFATKQDNFTKKDASKSFIEPRKSKFSGKRNTKQESISLNKFKHTQLNNSQAPKNRKYEHYPQTTDYLYLNNSGNQHNFNHSHAERNMILCGNWHDSYPKTHSRPNHRMVYLSPYPEHPGHNEGMFQYYRADNLYQGQQMYRRPYVAQYDHCIKDKQINERSFEGRTYERNWDFLY